MSKEDLKTAEHRAYAKGYAVGRRRKQWEISRETLKRKKDAFWVRAYLAVLPAAFSAQNWNRGGRSHQSAGKQFLRATGWGFLADKRRANIEAGRMAGCVASAAR